MSESKPFIPNTEALFGSSLTEVHLRAAETREERWHAEGPSIRDDINDNPFVIGEIRAYESLYGAVIWRELPGYPAPDAPVSASEEPGSCNSDFVVRSMFGIGDGAQSMMLIRTFSLPDCFVDSTLHAYRSYSGMKVVQHSGGPTDERRASIETIITFEPEGVFLARHHSEHVLAGDDVAARCLAAMQLVRSVRSLNNVVSQNAPDVFVESARAMAQRTWEELGTLCTSAPPKNWDHPQAWDAQMTRYLMRHAVPSKAAIEILEGKRPHDVGIFFD